MVECNEDRCLGNYCPKWDECMDQGNLFERCEMYDKKTEKWNEGCFNCLNFNSDDCPNQELIQSGKRV